MRFGSRFVYSGILAAAVLSPLAQTARATTTGSFFLEWTDRVGVVHPLADTTVSLYDYNISPGVDHLIGSFTTDDNGNLNFSTSYTRSGGGPMQIYLDVQASIPNVGRAVVNAGDANPYTLQLPGTFSVPNNSSGNSFTPSAVNDTTDAGKAIGFMQDVKFMHDYYSSLGATVSNSVNVQFASMWGNGSSESGGSVITLGYDSWGAWDILSHEYSHTVAANNSLDISPQVGYSHTFGLDNINRVVGSMTLTPYVGAQLAWQEGIATYMGTSALNAHLNAAIPNMPAADSNTSYDRLSSTGSTTPDSAYSFSVNLESIAASVKDPNTGVVTNGFVHPLGEGDETTVAHIFWDLMDNTPSEAYPRAGHYDTISLGNQAVYNLMATAGSTNNGNLLSLWKAARSQYGTTPQSRAALGDVFEANSVSAIPGAAGGVADGGSTGSLTPTLAWTPQNDGHSTEFLVAIYSSDWNNMVDLSPQLDNVTSWQTDLLNPGVYNWVVISNSALQGMVDFNDSYWSGGATFTIVPEPSFMFLLALAPMLLLRRRHPVLLTR